jgi:predicted Zn-ribbon and HTH transcriptional regulator
MPKYRVFSVQDILQISQHIIKLRQGSFFVTNMCQFQFSNFKVKVPGDCPETNIMFIENINNKVKAANLRATGKLG